MEDLSSWKWLKGRLDTGTVARHSAGMRLPVTQDRYCDFHDHSGIEIVYHPTGRGVTAVEGLGKIEFEEGDVVLYAPGVRHDQRVWKEGEDCCVQIEVPRKDRPNGCLLVGRIDDALLRGEIEFLTRRMEGGALFDLRASAVLLQLLEIAFERTESVGKAEEHVRTAERYVQEHYATIKAVGEIAAAVGMGEDYLRHVFRRRRSKSLVGYLGEIRMARARVLLVHSNLPLKEMARVCGYSDEYYFSATFKKAEGLPPGLYRQRNRPGTDGSK